MSEKRKTGLYLEKSLLDELDKIAKVMELSRNRVIRMAIRYFLWQWYDDAFDTGEYFSRMKKEQLK